MAGFLVLWALLTGLVVTPFSWLGTGVRRFAGWFLALALLVAPAGMVLLVGPLPDIDGNVPALAGLSAGLGACVLMWRQRTVERLVTYTAGISIRDTGVYGGPERKDPYDPRKEEIGARRRPGWEWFVDSTLGVFVCAAIVAGFSDSPKGLEAHWVSVFSLAALVWTLAFSRKLGRWALAVGCVGLVAVVLHPHSLWPLETIPEPAFWSKDSHPRICCR